MDSCEKKHGAQFVRNKQNLQINKLLELEGCEDISISTKIGQDKRLHGWIFCKAVSILY